MVCVTFYVSLYHIISYYCMRILLLFESLIERLISESSSHSNLNDDQSQYTYITHRFSKMSSELDSNRGTFQIPEFKLVIEVKKGFFCLHYELLIVKRFTITIYYYCYML